MALKKLPPKETVSARREQLREEHADAVREKIQTTSLVNVLQGYALGTSKVKMTGTRLKAIELLLDKTIPNLASVKHEVEHSKVAFFINTDYSAPDKNLEE